MIKLDIKTALPKMITAYNKKRLGIQLGKHECKYKYGDGSCCIVGAAMPKNLADEYNGQNISSLVEDGIVETKHIKTLEALQAIHDEGCWACDQVSRENHIARLKNRLNTLAKRYKIKVRAA